MSNLSYSQRPVRHTTSCSILLFESSRDGATDVIVTDTTVVDRLQGPQM